MAEQVTFRSATVRDVDRIFNLVSMMAQSGLMLRRSKYKNITMLANFIVAETAEERAVGPRRLRFADAPILARGMRPGSQVTSIVPRAQAGGQSGFAASGGR
jgi:hypothetical protein